MDEPKTEAVRAHFDRAAGDYQLDSERGLWRHLRSREEAALMELLAPQAGERILDAGSGAGYYSRLLQDVGALTTALDLSPTMLDSLKQRLAIETIVGDLSNVQLEPLWDKVLCAGALEFVDDPPTAVANMARALRPDGPGRIVLLLPKNSLAGRVYRLFHRRHGFRVNLFASREISALAEAASDFRIDTIRHVTFNLAVSLQRE